MNGSGSAWNSGSGPGYAARTLEVRGIRFAAIVVAGLVGVGGACGDRNAHAPGAAKHAAGQPYAPSAATRIAAGHACMPDDVDVLPSGMALTGTRLAFCLAMPALDPRAGDRYCFTVDLEAKTIVASPAPAAAAGDGRGHKDVFGASTATIQPSVHGHGLTVCTADKATCHELPIDAESIGSRPTAVSDDATLVAIDTRSYRPSDTQRAPGRVETWDAVTGKRIGRFDMHYGPDRYGSDHGPGGIVGFLGHTVIAFTMECALPCSTATMYSVRGKYLGILGADPTAATADRFHDDLYMLRSNGPDNGPFVVQDAATGKTMQLDGNTNWDAVVTTDLIVRVVGPSPDPAPRPPRVEVWGPNLTLVTDIAVPKCEAAPVGSGGR